MVEAMSYGESTCGAPERKDVTAWLEYRFKMQRVPGWKPTKEIEAAFLAGYAR